MSKYAEDLLEAVVGVPLGGPQQSMAYDDGVGSTHPQEMKRRRRKENFGMAGMPGGVRNDPESPNTYESRATALINCMTESGRHRLYIHPRVVFHGKANPFYVDVFWTNAIDKQEAITEFIDVYSREFEFALWQGRTFTLPQQAAAFVAALDSRTILDIH